jgi:hypothetical protein
MINNRKSFTQYLVLLERVPVLLERVPVLLEWVPVLSV